MAAKCWEQVRFSRVVSNAQPIKAGNSNAGFIVDGSRAHGSEEDLGTGVEAVGLRGGSIDLQSLSGQGSGGIAGGYVGKEKMWMTSSCACMAKAIPGENAYLRRS